MNPTKTKSNSRTATAIADDFLTEHTDVDFRRSLWKLMRALRLADNAAASKKDGYFTYPKQAIEEAVKDRTVANSILKRLHGDFIELMAWQHKSDIELFRKDGSLKSFKERYNYAWVQSPYDGGVKYPEIRLNTSFYELHRKLQQLHLHSSIEYAEVPVLRFVMDANGDIRQQGQSDHQPCLTIQIKRNNKDALQPQLLRLLETARPNSLSSSQLAEQTDHSEQVVRDTIPALFQKIANKFGIENPRDELYASNKNGYRMICEFQFSDM